MNNDQRPLEPDVLETRAPKDKGTLSEKDFIHEPPPTGGLPVWLWLFIFTVIASLIWGSLGWYENTPKEIKLYKPFLNVTNRDLSVFLWQFPNFLRANVKTKTGYLPGFQYGDKQTLHVESADEVAVAPPDLLFLYHTWRRLLAPDYIVRPIPLTEFKEFLNQVEEWKPQYWSEAPESYKQFIQELNSSQVQDLRAEPEANLPIIVRQAFQGWKNYFKEGALINDIKPTVKQVQDFLSQYPTYARNYWRNIQTVANQPVAGLDYLALLNDKTVNPEDIVPSTQLSSFLKAALFNAEQAAKGE